MAFTLQGQAQRVTDQLDRGLIAMKTSRGMYLNWRILADEYYDVTYNVYRDGQLLNDKPLTVSNYTDTEGNTANKYTVAAVVNGDVKAQCKEANNWNTSYTEIQLKHEGIKSTLIPNDATCADVDGDGELEIIMKFDNLSEMEQSYPKNGPKINGVDTKEYTIFECIKLDGTRLWWLNCGPNMADFQNNEQNIMAYDWDGDGKAECVMRATDGLTMHMRDGSSYTVGDPNSNVRADFGGGLNWFVCTDGEYLLYFNGETGAKYQDLPYPLKLRETSGADLTAEWGDKGWAHRSSKHFFGAPYLDGKKPSIFLARGIYTRHKMIAYDVNPTTHELTERWRWFNNSNGPWKGQGYHNYCVADVDWDGRDEIVFGSMVIDDNGKGLSTTGLGHGDAEHVGNFDPYRHGHEIFACMEDNPGTNYRDATTSKILYRYIAGKDVGRCMAGNFTNDFPGSMGTPTDVGPISLVTCKTVPGITEAGVNQNMCIYWDGDLLEETFNYVNGENTAGCIAKYGSWSPIYTLDGSYTNNGTKGTPCFQGDILGDWREEVIMRTANHNIRIYSTPATTKYRIPSLWNDHQYRNAMVWQMCGYNQPPRPSFFLGELEGITMAPPPLTNTGRTLVANGATIGSSLNGQHVLLFDYANTSVTLDDGVQPSVLTFNVPSLVSGTAPSECTNKDTYINYNTYTCTVTAGSLAGNARLVKQGDGTLNLPAVAMNHTGNTDFWAGIVNFDGQLMQSSLWMNHFTTLNTTGGTFRSINMTYDAKLNIGSTDEKSNVSVDTLTMGIGARVRFDIYCADFTADLLTAKQLTIVKKNWKYGPAYISPVFEFNIHRLESQETSTGRYPIAKVEKIVGDINDVRIEGVDNKRKSHLEYEDGTIYLVIEGMRDAHGIVWRGDKSNIWDLGETENFTAADDVSGGSDIFVTGDQVTFDATASNFTVNISGEVEADTIFIDGSSNYTFQGDGSLTGNTSLVKRGSGVLTIKNMNNYRGSTRISGGAVNLTALANEITETGNFGAINSRASEFVLENGAELRTSNAITNGAPMTMEGALGGVINNQYDFTTTRAIYGTRLTKRGTGWLKVGNDNLSLDKMVIESGTAQMNCGTPAKLVELRNATIQESRGTGYSIYVAPGVKGYWNLVDNAGYSNTLTGSGEVQIYCPLIKGDGWVATRTRIGVNWTNFEGTITCATPSYDHRFSLDNTYSMPKGTLNIPEGIEVQNRGHNIHIGQLAGTGALGGLCTFTQNNENLSPNTWQIGNDTTYTWKGYCTSNSNLVKVGSGKVYMYGASNHTGSTTISVGEIGITTSTRLGEGALTIEPNGTLSGTNTTKSTLSNTSYTINGTLRPGIIATVGTGTMYFNSKDITIGEKGVLQVTAQKCATSAIGGCSAIAGIAKLTFNGTLRVLVGEGCTLTVGDSIRVWKATEFEGTPKFDFEKGITWDTSRISEGLLFVKAISLGITPTRRAVDPTDIFDLSGRLVRRHADTTDGLPAGIYLRGGRKIVIK